MKDKIKKIGTKIKDGIIIGRIKTANFIKEHKLVSTFIGLFLVSGIIAFVVFADEYANNIKVVSPAVTAKEATSSTEESTSVQSFSTLIYEVSYKLDYKGTASTDKVIRDKVIIEATYEGNYDLTWDDEDNSALYVVEKGNKKKVIVTISNVTVGEANTQKLYLKVGNVANNTKINVDIKIHESTDSDWYEVESKTKTDSSKKINPVTVSSTLTELVPYVVSGTAYKDENIANGRYAPFGIVLGISKEKLNNGTLKGLYFNPNQEITLEALQSIGADADKSEIELVTAKDYYGVYKRSQNLFDIPNGILKDYTPSVFYSGDYNLTDNEATTDVDESANNIKLSVSPAGASGENVEVSNPNAYLIGDKVIDKITGDAYTEYGIETSESGTAICKTTSTTCTRTITTSSGAVATETDLKNKAGDYKVTYTIKSENGETTIVRKVKVTEKESINVDDVVYTLSGAKEVYVLKDSTYGDEGILKGTAKLQETDTAVTLTSDPVVDTSAVKDYTVRYTIKSKTTSETGTLKRTVHVVETLPTTTLKETKAPVISTNSMTITLGTKITPLVSIDGTEKECTSENKCTMSYATLTGEAIEGTPNSVGTYKVIYKYAVTADNGADYIVTATNKLTIQIKYILKINNINTDGRFYSMNNMAVLGSYFVTAKSVRPADKTDDILVYLKANNNELSNATYNYNFSKGVKTYRTGFYKEESAGLNEIASGNSVAYGEEVVLRSEFKYSKDGDEKIKTLTVNVPVNTATSNSSNPTAPFSMIEYSNLAEAEPYYINEDALNNMEDFSVIYNACEMNETVLGCTDGKVTTYTNYDKFIEDAKINDKLKLAYVTYTAKNVKPGTSFDFRLKLQTTVGNYGSITIASSANYDSTNDKDTKSAIATLPITAFKARSKLYINNEDKNVTIDGSNTSISTFSVYPSVTLPAEMVNTNAAGIGALDYVNAVVTLPKGINYVYNDDYLKPSTTTKNADGSTTLNYIVRGVRVNDWIEPINIDASYDINIPSGTSLVVKVITQAKANSSIIDNSSVEVRTSTKTIMYQNNEVIAYGLYTPYTAISKETSFNVTAKLYNNSTSSMDNLELVTLLPYNDISNEKENHTGTYTLGELPERTLCTTALPTLITNSDKLLNDSEIEWEACSKHKEDNYAGVTALKTTGITLSTSQLYENTITIKPTGNKTDDAYEVNSYLILNNSTVKNIKPVKVSVVSKKIIGTVWEDFDSDGLLGSEEIKVSGVTLNLYNSETNELVQTVTSDKDGKYAFTDLLPATYYVVADYNTAKYGLSPYQASYDLSIASSFKSEDVNVISKEENASVIWQTFLNNFKETEYYKYYEDATDTSIKVDSTDTTMKVTIVASGKTYVTNFKYENGILSYVPKNNTSEEYYVNSYMLSNALLAAIPTKNYVEDEFMTWLDKQDIRSLTLGNDGIETDIDGYTYKVNTFKLDLVNGFKSFEASTDNTSVKAVRILTDNITVTENTKTISNINLGLALRKIYTVGIKKYISKVITTNRLGVSTTKDFGNVTLAKINVKDMNNISVKVIYTIELENTGYYPGYIYNIKDYLPDGMSFNTNYQENSGWVLNDNGYLENSTLSTTLIKGGEKKYITLALDISRKEAGSFINYASVEDEDLQILMVAGPKEGDNNE